MPDDNDDALRLLAEQHEREIGQLHQQLLEAWADGTVPEGTTAEAEVIKRSGLTPIEFLCSAYRNPFNPMKERINAAKSVMEYVHKKIATELKVKGDPSAPLGAVRLDVGKLSDDELVQLAALLEKVGADEALPPTKSTT